MTDAFALWQEENREYLVLAIDDLHARMGRGEPDEATTREDELARLAGTMRAAPALLTLAGSFELGDFERDVVLMCLASELDPRFQLDGMEVTVGLALESLPEAHWNALDDGAPLLRWGLVVREPAPRLADAALRLAPDVTRYLMGFDPRLGHAQPFTLVPPPPRAVAAHAEAAEALAGAIAHAAAASGMAPAVEVHGADEEDRLTVALLCADRLGFSLVAADARDLPQPGAELDELLRSWARRARLTGTLLCVVQAAARDDDPSLRHRVEVALARVADPIFVVARRAAPEDPARTLIRQEVREIDPVGRAEIWMACLEPVTEGMEEQEVVALEEHVRWLAHHFRLGWRTIQRICRHAEVALEAGDEPPSERLPALMREGCAGAVRSRLDPVAERVPLGDVHEVAVAEEAAAQLDELVAQIRLAAVVSDRWGFDRERGGGPVALFSGPSGTGKTHAAMALARRAGLDLYRVNLAAILSKYIGETERNLDRVFEAAAVGGAILLFDEADALFGRRSEVRDSHDRYANLSSAYLLQRIESARTPAILTTNLLDAIDPAFLRRLHFVVEFPFPAPPERERIWRTVFPDEADLGEIAPQRLAAVTATGATIANIARRSAYLAAAEPSPVEMRHLLAGAKRELRKLGRDLSPEEMATWR